MENGVYVGVEDEDDHQASIEDDGFGDIWNEMSMAVEVTKSAAADHSSDEPVREDEETCHHSFILKDDLGYVCRVCRVIDRGIETIFEFQYVKARCQSEGSKLKGCEKDLFGETNSLSGESLGTSIQVQMGNSVDIFFVQDERTAVSCRS